MNKGALFVGALCSINRFMIVLLFCACTVQGTINTFMMNS